MKELRFIHPNDLHEYWPLILSGLQKIKSADGWIPEDVYHALKSQVSTLHVAYHDGYAGFCVLTPMQSYKHKVLHIWCTYMEKPGLLETFITDLDEMARNIGAKRLTFSSPRKGWERSDMFKQTQVFYEREV